MNLLVIIMRLLVKTKLIKSPFLVKVKRDYILLSLYFIYFLYYIMLLLYYMLYFVLCFILFMYA